MDTERKPDTDKTDRDNQKGDKPMPDQSGGSNAPTGQKGGDKR